MSNSIDFRLIRQLWMFLAVAEEQHFGRAAKRLNMSQPPLTEQIKVLEQSLKLQLFNRSRKGTQLSPAGAAILPAVRQFAGQVERLERVIREVAAGQSGVLHVGAITSAMLETVPPVLDSLKRGHPNLTVLVSEIDSVDAVPALEAGNLTWRLRASMATLEVVSRRCPSPRTGSPWPCQRITHWQHRREFAFAL